MLVRKQLEGKLKKSLDINMRYDMMWMMKAQRQLAVMLFVQTTTNLRLKMCEWVCTT